MVSPIVRSLVTDSTYGVRAAIISVFLDIFLFLQNFKMSQRDAKRVGFVRLHGQVIGFANQVDSLLFQIFASDAPLLKAEHLAPLSRQVNRYGNLKNVTVSQNDTLQSGKKNKCLRRLHVHNIFDNHLVGLVFCDDITDSKTHLRKAYTAVFLAVQVDHSVTDIFTILKNSPAGYQGRLIKT
nr:MAG TPA: hypothetical protein [Bacteriophage sp.]